MTEKEKQQLNESDICAKFITRWQNSGAAERSNYALFLSELCDLLEVPRPDPSTEDNAQNDYVIDRAFTRNDRDAHTSTVYLDLYKRGHFVLETKQGSSGTTTGGKVGHGRRGTQGWDKALEKAYNQAFDYIRDIPTDHGRPPFLIVCDVGHCFDIYSEFTGTGGTYLAFPTPSQRRIFLEDLRDPEVRQLLKTIWTDPTSLDPSKHAAKVTREVADTLAQLASSLEKAGHDPQLIAIFLQRLLFTLFAEDVGLLPEKSFEKLLEQATKSPKGFAPLVTALWKDMATGTEFSTVLMQKVIHFNGGLFENPQAIPLELEHIQLLLKAAKQDWKEVEPAIFGTLLERALDPRERHKLGAHYTPRSYVERLIQPTLMQPLRDQWNAVKTAAAILHDLEKDDKARAEIETFHKHLCTVKVLDPACGSGNFLYVALARIKELEAEVLDLLEELGGNRLLEMDSNKVRPSQFLGIEINSRASAIAQLVLWIGYFQWHHKTTGKADTNDRPLLESQQTIQNRDAVLDYDDRIPRLDDDGNIMTIWDGHTTKPHPVTGKEVPDPSAKKPLFDFINPRRTQWPQADYIVGNPPFLGTSRMREGLGDGYVEALRKAWKSFKPDSWDFVMFWWHQAAETVRDKKANSFGFITTNSISQTFNRRCIEPFLNNEKKPLSITYAIPDHPWVDSADGAVVRIAMTVARFGKIDGDLQQIVEEAEQNEDYFVELESKTALIAANLKSGADIAGAGSLLSNNKISSRGMSLHGKGFFIDSFINDENLRSSNLIFPFIGSTDIVQRHRNRYVIDAFGLTAEELAKDNPSIYQYLVNSVKPERDQNNRESYRKKWWLYGEPRKEFRPSTKDIKFYIVTPRTAKHRIFTTFDKRGVPESELVCISLDKYWCLSVLSSTVHTSWTISQGGTMGKSVRYNNSRCFINFPFPNLDDKPALKQTLSTLGEQLDAHRKTRQAEHPDLTLTGMYNVLEKLRADEPLTAKDKTIHDQGLVTLLKQIHDDIDKAVYEAYGWSDIWNARQALPDIHDLEAGTISKVELDQENDEAHMREATEALDQVLLQRLVDLNHERAAEEAEGKIRYLRPEFQDPDHGKDQSPATQKTTAQDLKLTTKKAKPTKATTSKLKWPTTLPEQVAILQPLITTQGSDPTTLSTHFGRASKKRQSEIQQILQTLKALGQI